MTPELRDLVHWLAELVVAELRDEQTSLAATEPTPARPTAPMPADALRDLRPLQH